MRRRWAIPIFLFLLLAILTILSSNRPVQASGSAAQLPTGSMATVTGTPTGPIAVVRPGNEPQANLRSGPGALYDRVGVLLMGQSVPAKGRSPGGEWILVEYQGVPGGRAWVYEPLVEILPPNTTLSIVEPPPTPTPVVTATIDPTLAARFVITQVPTRLPTFTNPAPIVIPTFTENAGPALGGIPMGFVIMGLAALGIFFGIVAFSQR